MAMSPRLMSPRASGFNPRSIESLRAWYDASDDTQFTYSSGTVVSEWRDKSGYALHATHANAAQQPTRNVTRNGRTAVAFQNSPRVLTIADMAAAFPTAATGVFVYGPGSNEYNIFFTSATTSFTSYSGNGYSAFFKATRLTNTPAMPSTGFHVVTWISSATQYTIRQNGTQILTAAADFTAGSSHRIGSSTNGNAANHTSCEILLFNETLSTAQLKTVERYAGNRWGITVA
jgi:hypothetical protein